MSELTFVQNWDSVPKKPHRTRSIVCVFGFESQFTELQLDRLRTFATSFKALCVDGSSIHNKGCVVFGKENGGEWFVKTESESPETWRFASFEKALVAVYQKISLPVPPELNGKMAYFTLSHGDFGSVKLSYNARTQFALGRSLVFCQQPLPRVRGRSSASFHHSQQAALYQRQVPTDQECRILHAMGLMLTEQAMLGNPRMIVPQRVNDNSLTQKADGNDCRGFSKNGHSLIVHPEIFATTKYDTDEWGAGSYHHGKIFLNPDHGFTFTPALGSLQDVHDAFTSDLRVDRVDVVARAIEMKLVPFQSRRERFAAFRRIASNPQHPVFRGVHFA